MEAILEPLVRSPKLRLYVDELNETLRLEQEARERFRESLNEDIRAEFINGDVFMHSPARDTHTLTVKNLTKLLDTYVQLHRLGIVRSEQALAEFTRNDYAPDICFWGSEKARRIEPDTFYYPVPDFVCEVLSPSTEANDRGVKFEDYAAHGVSEYWIVDPDARVIEGYGLQHGQFIKDADHRPGDVIRSRAVKGFILPVAAVFDEAANLEALRALMGSQTNP